MLGTWNFVLCYVEIGFFIWDLHDFVLQKNVLLNQTEFYKLHMGHNTSTLPGIWPGHLPR